MSVGEVQATFCATLVDEWVRSGLTDAVVCPGSRSTPLAVALAERTEIRCHVRLDERGAAFFALGLGLATGRPATVVTTSGTAAAELHPAVVEAHHARVPLLACTADRPPTLHHVGAPQTIEQNGLFGPAVRWSCDPGMASPTAAGTWRALAARAWAEATSGPDGPGPVHLNLAFDEPLCAEPGPLPEGRPGGAPRYGPGAGGAVADAGEVAKWPSRRGVVVAGARCGPPSAVLGLAARLGWPVLADPRSACRTTHPCVVGAADLLARCEPLRRSLLPEVVLLVGDPWTSKALSTMVAEASAAGAEVVGVDPWWRWIDPDRVVTSVHRADPGQWLEAAAGALSDEGPAIASGGDWLERWQEAERVAQRAIDDVLAAEQRLTEPAVARLLPGALPKGSVLVAASSMPVRDLEWFAPPMPDPPQVLANRGANGIDGVGATAQGVAAAGLGPVVGLLGDLAFLHDASSLVRPATAADTTTAQGTSCTLVVVDNGGGGIFNFLPQAAALPSDRFEQLFGTPQAPQVAAVARGFGLPVAEVDTAAGLVEALAETVGAHPLAVVRAEVPARQDNVAVHERLASAVAAACQR
jgi:2-succinyl-5-enolpyruvyl-6-hydroxy-3-cyclohexene-1-carboxylate synthase